MTITTKKTYLAFDVGEKRIGVATATEDIKIPIALTTLLNDELLETTLGKVLGDVRPDVIVVGHPRNQSGETTVQTRWVVNFVDTYLASEREKIIFQDESLTSVMAENYLKQTGRPYDKGDIDARAAAIILEDYLGVRR